MDWWSAEAVFEIQVVEVGGTNRVLLKSDGVVVIGIGGEWSVPMLCSVVFHDAAHGTMIGCAGGCLSTGVGGIEATSKLFVGIGYLHFQLRVLLSQAFGDDVVYKTIAVFEFVAGLLASQANGAS
jgi:hypothetical protein